MFIHFKNHSGVIQFVVSCHDIFFFFCSVFNQISFSKSGKAVSGSSEIGLQLKVNINICLKKWFT